MGSTKPEVSEFIETATGNAVSRQSVLCAPQNIHLFGKSVIHKGAMIRGDLANVRMGRNCVLSCGAVLRPFFERNEELGDAVFIGADAIVEAVAIGSNVYIGENCIVGKRTIVKDCCWIMDNTVLTDDTVVAPFSIYGGCPGRLLRELPHSAPGMIQMLVKSRCLPTMKNVIEEIGDHDEGGGLDRRNPAIVL